MLEFKKTILSKVSFDAKLFEKELTKAIEWVSNDDLLDLKKWCYKNYKGQYKKILDEKFASTLLQA